MGKKQKQTSGKKIISKNREAWFKYYIEEPFEAGIELIGSEVKSLRDGHVSLKESYARVINGELMLLDLHIPEYKNAGYTTHTPNRARRLLVHKREIKKLEMKIKAKGHTLVPLKLYFNARGYCKIEIGLELGKKLYDKRDDLKKRDAAREMGRYSR